MKRPGKLTDGIFHDAKLLDAWADRPLTVAKAAQLLGMSARHVRALCARGEIVAADVSEGSKQARWLIRRSQLVNYLIKREGRERPAEDHLKGL